MLKPQVKLIDKDFHVFSQKDVPSGYVGFEELAEAAKEVSETLGIPIAKVALEEYEEYGETFWRVTGRRLATEEEAELHREQKREQLQRNLDWAKKSLLANQETIKKYKRELEQWK